MTSPELWNSALIALIGATPPCVIAWLGYKAAQEARREAKEANVVSKENKVSIEKTQVLVEETAENVDGKLKELMASNIKIAHAEGEKEGKSDEIAKQAIIKDAQAVGVAEEKVRQKAVDGKKDEGGGGTIKGSSPKPRAKKE